MFSRIQDLPRYKADIKRFTLGIDSTSSETQEKGQACLDSLIKAVSDFDNSMSLLLKQEGHSSHMDHVSAQEAVKTTKDAMESWMLMYAPNIHVDEAEFSQTA